MSAEAMMRRCLALAEKGLGSVAPNPMVGAVVTVDGRIIGEGYHEKFGGPHAEVNAITSVKDRSLLGKSRLHVNLEPCCHTGKTPPCTDLILASKIPEVVVGCTDAYPEVAGRGIQILREGGVKVEVGVLQKECLELNRRFFTFHSEHRPYIILKWAETADGFIARSDHSSKWISTEASRTLVHKWRSEEAAIMVGTDTLLYDDPELSVRHCPGNNPVRVIIDRTLRLPKDRKVFDGSIPTLVINRTRSEVVNDNLEYLAVEGLADDLRPVLNLLHQRKLLSCLVEGGAKFISAIIEQGLWDEARVFTAQGEYGQGVPAPKITGLLKDETSATGDKLRVYRPGRELL